MRPTLARLDVVVVETGSVVGQRQVEVGDVDVRLVPVDQRDPISSLRMLRGLGSPWTTQV